MQFHSFLEARMMDPEVFKSEEVSPWDAVYMNNKRNMI
jgi:hypothetical protein